MAVPGDGIQHIMGRNICILISQLKQMLPNAHIVTGPIQTKTGKKKDKLDKISWRTFYIVGQDDSGEK